MSMMSEFKSFAMRGNVVDMAVGIIIGVAFGKIVSSFVSDVLMPPIGLLMGGVDFSDLAFTLKEAAGDAAASAHLRIPLYGNHRNAHVVPCDHGHRFCRRPNRFLDQHVCGLKCCPGRALDY